MNVLVDGQPITLEFPDDSLLKDVIKKISDTLNSGRCIQTLTLDGEDITGRIDNRLVQIDQFQRLEVQSTSASEMASETLNSLEEFGKSLLNELSKTADEFRMGDEDLSNQIFLRCLDGLQILIRMTFSTANLLEVDLKEIQAGPISISSSVDKINRLLDELIEAQTQNDTILLADLLEYELQPMVEDWMKGLPLLRKVGTPA